MSIKKTLFPVSYVVVLGLCTSVTFAEPSNTGEFEGVEIFVVYSSTDLDAQVFLAGESDEPLTRLKAVGPAGVRLSWKVKDGGDLGYADFQFESPEPSLEELEVAYPAGTYSFHGRTNEGTKLTGEAELSYELLDAPVPIFPLNGDTGVPTNGVITMWEPISDAEAIRFEIEDEEGEVAFKVDLPGDAVSFDLPNGWLEPATEYTLDIKAIGENGNQTVTDLRFTTAGL